MKLITAALTGLALVATISFASDQPVSGDLVEVPARKVYLPKGFDNNDDVIAVISGSLPSGCYRVMRPMVRVDQERKLVLITPLARFFDVPCIGSQVPYDYEVSLGQLAAGEYTVKIGDRIQAEKLAVKVAANLGPDDELYAPVDQATVDQDPHTGAMRATILGRFPNSCARWDEVKVVDSGETIEVLPVMSLNETGEGCVAGEFPFKKHISLPRNKPEGRYLLHVRSLNGKAVSQIFHYLAAD